MFQGLKGTTPSNQEVLVPVPLVGVTPTSFPPFALRPQIPDPWADLRPVCFRLTPGFPSAFLAPLGTQREVPLEQTGSKGHLSLLCSLLPYSSRCDCVFSQ